MGVIAIAKIQNTGKLAEDRGWSLGYRLIDAKSGKTLDVSNEVIKIGLTERNLSIANLSISDDGDIEEMLSLADKYDEGLPVVMVTNENGKGSQLGSNAGRMSKLVLLWIYTDSELGIDLCEVSDCLGNIKTVRLAQVLEAERQEKLILLNHIREKEERRARLVGHCKRAMGTLTKFLDTQVSEGKIYNKGICEHRRRCKALNIPGLRMCDAIGSDKAVLLAAAGDIGEYIEIPDYVEEIGESAFVLCSKPRNITFGSGVRIIGYSGLSGVELDNLSLNEGLLEIHEDAFQEAEIRSDIVIPSSVQKIATTAFQDLKCPRLVITTNHLEVGSGGVNWTIYLSRDIGELQVSEDTAVKILSYYVTGFEKNSVRSGIVEPTGNKLTIPYKEAEDILNKELGRFGLLSKNGVKIIP